MRPKKKKKEKKIGGKSVGLVLLELTRKALCGVSQRGKEGTQVERKTSVKTSLHSGRLGEQGGRRGGKNSPKKVDASKKRGTEENKRRRTFLASSN